MTPQLIAIYIGIGFIIGFIVTALICLNIHDRHKKAWMIEYRRLMGGIDHARRNAIGINTVRGDEVARYLLKIYRNEPIWPRG